MAHIELKNYEDEKEVKALATDILGEGAWEKLSQEILEKSLVKNWKEQKGYEGVLNDFTNAEANDAFSASVNATIIEKIKNIQ
ncbi:hypothetical protein P4679_33185 [Priestia megaterium]|uniref:hypothetical protein n=1 Tax=Priestia megaterium TaxID=1404 RepID=UPI002E1FC037|nr:hypothetical protein [Priestia megaterium]